MALHLVTSRICGFHYISELLLMPVEKGSTNYFQLNKIRIVESEWFCLAHCQVQVTAIYKLNSNKRYERAKRRVLAKNQNFSIITVFFPQRLILGARFSGVQRRYREVPGRYERRRQRTRHSRSRFGHSDQPADGKMLF